MITSDKNEIIKQIMKLKMKKQRDKTNLFYIEGERFVDEIPKDYIVENYILSEKFDLNLDDLDKYESTKSIVIADDLFKKISDTKTPQGIMAICKVKNYNIDDIKITDKSLFLMLERINDAGNLGTIIRSAEALGVSAIFMSKGCVDLYNEKTLRSTMGAIFHIPILVNCDFDYIIDFMKKNKVNTICTSLNTNKNIYDVNFKNAVCIIVGNEANGVLDKYIQKSDENVTIPMVGEMESINVATSTSIILYEALRQRLNK